MVGLGKLRVGAIGAASVGPILVVAIATAMLAPALNPTVFFSAAGLALEIPFYAEVDKPANWRPPICFDQAYGYTPAYYFLWREVRAGRSPI